MQGKWHKELRYHVPYSDGFFVELNKTTILSVPQKTKEALFAGFFRFLFFRDRLFGPLFMFFCMFMQKNGENKHYQKRGFVIFFFGKSPIYRVFPRGARTFRTVLTLGVVFPFSILAIMGCLTPLIASSSLWVIPLACPALISSPMSAIRQSLLSAVSNISVINFMIHGAVLNAAFRFSLADHL